MKHLYKLILSILLICSINKIQAQITVSYGYDELHRLKTCTYSNGIIVNYNYDALGNRTTVVVSGVASCIAPSNLSVSNIGSTGATLNWNYTSGQTYTVEYKASTSTIWITASSSVIAGNYTVTGLSANTTYNWRVKANCNTTYVGGANFTTLTNCIAVTDLSVSNITTNAVTLNWTYTTGYSYTLEWKVSSSNTWILASSSVNLGTFTGSGLTPNTSYDFRVKSNCSVNFTDTISVITLNNCTLPIANFNNTNNNLSVNFTNSSTNAISYNWNFGNGQTSTQQNPSITYAIGGTYNVCLTATNSCGSVQTCKNVQVTNLVPNLVCNDQPVINPNPIVKGNPANMALSVINNGQGLYSGMLYLMWRNNSSGFKLDSSNVSLSNGQTKTLSMISTGILSNAGTWLLQIEDRNGNVYCSTSVVVVDCNLPVSNYSYTTNGLSVSLTNISTNATSYSWNFGNGQTSTNQNPSITFTTAGTYNVCLTATNSCGSTNYCQTVTVSNTCVKPTAQFTFVSNGLATNFTNASLNGVTYNWNFGNGQTSILQHPNVTYSTAGNYNVCLTATNACDTNRICKLVTVSTCDTVNKYDIYNVINTVPQINKEGYFYYNGTHYLVWSNGHHTQTNPNNSYDAKVKLSTSTDGKTWNTQDILNTTIGSTNHVMTIDSVGKIHIAYVEGTTPNYWGLQYGRLVYANNVNGSWVKVDTTLGTGNGNSYNWSSPYHLMFGYDGKLRMYYTNAGWFAYGAPLYMRVLDGSTWTTPITISNTNDGGADSQNNLWSFTKKSNGQIQVYLSDGWKCTGNGCTEVFYNNMRVFTEGVNYTYSLTKNIPNTRWYYENQMGDSIKVQTDGKTVSVNNVLLNTLSGTEIIRNNTWIDNTKQYAIENTNTNSRVFKVTTGQSIVNNIGQYIIPANGFQIAVDYGSNPRRLYTIHQGNNTSIIANFNSTANNLDVTFTNTTTNAITYNWSFGNGQTSTQLNPTITYTTAGNYDVCLVASNTCNSVQVCKQVSVTCPVPFANFSNTVNNTNVVFTNNSTNATSYNWNFGNGQTSTQVNPSINYGNGGNYTVCLRATNTCGFDDTCKNINIVITSITQNQLDNLISIFPNPNNGTFSVKMDKTLTSNVELAIYDVEGRVVHEQAISQQETAVSTVNLPSGVYIINIRMADDKIIKHKLVIMR